MQKMNIQLFAEDEQEQIYLDQIEDLKKQLEEGSVPKEKYDKLMADYKKLLNDYVNRRPAPKQDDKPVRKVREIAKELASIKDGSVTNRDYIAKSLEYREAYIREYGQDPFTDFGQKGPKKPTEETESVAQTLQKILDENPSPVDFRIKMNSILEDDPHMAKMRKRA